MNTDSHANDHHHHDGNTSKPHGDLRTEAGEMPFIDPVCGMNVAAAPEKKIVHAGHDYFFCSVRCMEKFGPDPDAYLNRDATVPPAPALAGAIYTCPMHPEIQQAGPGSCPTCGMALEPMMPSLDEEESPELVDFRHRFWWTLPLSIAGFGLAMFGHLLFSEGLANQSLIELVLSTPVVLWAGWPLFIRCVQSIGNRSPNMWTLIGAGVAAAYGRVSFFNHATTRSR